MKFTILRAIHPVTLDSLTIGAFFRFTDRSTYGENVFQLVRIANVFDTYYTLDVEVGLMTPIYAATMHSTMVLKLTDIEFKAREL